MRSGKERESVMSSESTVLGVEIGGTKLQVALGKGDGSMVMLERGQVDVEDGAPGILAWLEENLHLLLGQAKQAGLPAPQAIGVGFGGPVESATGQVLVSHQIAGWEGVPLKEWFQSRFQGIPAVIANDSNAAGWAEYCLGAGKGTRNFAYMNIGSGIGGALVIEGRLFDGQGRGGGEMGHTYVPDWTAGAPGVADKLEHLCSGWSIEKRLRTARLPEDSLLLQQCGGAQDRLTCPMLAQAARDGDAFATGEIQTIARSLGLAVSNLITLFHPERVALGGGVALMGDVLLDALRRNVDELVFGPYRSRYDIVPCALKESVVVAGALLLAGAEVH